MRISNLKKTLGDFRLNIDAFELEEGLIHGIIGPNGCGKSTLAKIIAGLLEPDEGEVNLNGLTARDITLCPQRPYLLHDTVYNNLIYPLKIRRAKIDKEVVLQWLETAGLSAKRNQYALALSSGERQKLSIIRAMIFEPRLIIIDEALSNLDPESVELFEELILKVHKKNSSTWILISHQLAHIRRVCDKVHFMQKGSIIESGTTHDIFVNPENESLKEYLRRESI